MTEKRPIEKFCFYRFRFKKHNHADNSCGARMNYIAQLVKGTGRIVSDTETVELREGDVFFIPISLPYHSYWYGDEGGDIEFLSFGFFGTEAAEGIDFGLQRVDCDNSAREAVAAIPTDGSTPSFNALSKFYGALAALMPYLNKNQTLSKKDKILKRVKDYMAEHTECRAAEAAEACFISEPYLYLLFRERLGLTPHAYLLELRCEKGLEYLLTTDKTVEEISSLTGFSSAAHFRRALKAHTGATPKEIRKRRIF